MNELSSPIWGVFVILVVLSVSGCKPEPPATTDRPRQSVKFAFSPEQEYLADFESQSRFKALNSQFARAGRLDASELNALQEIHRKHPAIHEITDSLKRALSVAEDWPSLIELFDRVPVELIDKQLQAISMIQVNRFDDAVAVINSDRDALNDSDLAWLLGFALYHAGRHHEAVEVLGPLANRVSDKRLLDVLSLLGLTYIQLDDLDHAKSALQKAIAQDPNHLPSLVNLVSVLHRQGDTAQAIALDNRALELRVEQARLEARAMRLSSLSRQLNESWDAGDYARCRELIDQMLPDADEHLKAGLGTYLKEIERHSR